MGILLFLLAGCPDPRPPRPKPLPPEGDAGTATCSTACSNMRSLGCDLGEPTKKGRTCEEVCEAVRGENFGAGFPVGCLTASPSCEEAGRCR